jgi:hypothetical protein
MPSLNDPAIWFKDLFDQAGLSCRQSSLLSTVALAVIFSLLSWLLNIITKAIILKIVTRIVKRTSSEWDDIFPEQRVFTIAILKEFELKVFQQPTGEDLQLLYINNIPKK